MDYRRLGRTGLDVSVVGLGSGGLDPFGQQSGKRTVEEVHRLVHAALDLGITYFDTSPTYLNSEAILGDALAAVPAARYVLSSKVLLVGADGAMATEREIVESVESSLRNLKVESLDLLLLAAFVDERSYEHVLQEQLPVIDKLRRDGKVRFVGGSEKSAVDGEHYWLRRGLEDDLFDAVMVAYNIMNQTAERTIFPLAERNDVGTIGIYTVRSVFSDPARIREVMRELGAAGMIDADPAVIAAGLDWLVDDSTPSIVEAAYRYVMTGGLSCVMTGTTDIGHLATNIESVRRGPLAPEQIDRLHGLFGSVTAVVGN